MLSTYIISSTEYTIGVFGCTGRGKTTFCNFLFKEDRFKINDPDESQYCGWEDVSSITIKAQHGVLEDPIAGAELHVIDMPGLLATENMTGEGHADRVKDGRKLLEEFAKALDYIKDGIDVLFVTLKARARMSAEEEFLVEFLDGLQLWPYCVLLFTHGSVVGENKKDSHEAFCRYTETDDFKRKCPVLAKMVERADKRFVIVESVDYAGDRRYHRSKLDEIYKVIEIVRQEAGSPISHPILTFARNTFEMQQMLNIEEGNNPAQQEGDQRDHDESIDEYRCRTERLLTVINQHDLQTPQHFLLKQLDHYLSRVEDDPRSFVNAYAVLVEEVEDQKKTKDRLQKEIERLSREGWIGSCRKIAERLDSILKDQQPTNDGNPGNNNIQEANIEDGGRNRARAGSKCIII